MKSTKATKTIAMIIAPGSSLDDVFVAFGVAKSR